ncbi:MULE domain-containing protein [Aphis craccivora]|uniref:MULE domain-containing protein n=1 Tax=Aphis craccivora TaxID=307492 RepID=A0A6G0VM02_APHCR|nr:MULE domain-containing protein [Aphis craccivora]
MGIPVAFFISNRERACQERGEINVKVFMSDDFPAYNKEWTKVMGEVQYTLLCTWHVDKNFRKNLTLVNETVEIKSQAYKCIRTLLQETSQEVVYELLPKAIQQLLNNENTKRFGQSSMF